MVLKFQQSAQISLSFYHIHLNEYDAAETNVLLTEETFAFTPATHHKAKQVVKLCKFHICCAQDTLKL